MKHGDIIVDYAIQVGQTWYNVRSQANHTKHVFIVIGCIERIGTNTKLLTDRGVLYRLDNFRHVTLSAAEIGQ